jgi:hypothetical protein
VKNCPSCAKISRRELLTGAAAWAAFSTLARRGDAQINARPVTPKGTARACIFVNMEGAPSHLDTFDPKDGPWNPPDADLRQYGGLVLSRTLFPELSRLTNDLCLLHSITSWEAAHERGQFYLQTAHPSNPAFVAETPHLGSVIAMELGGQGPLPPFMSLNGGTAQGAKFLGGRLEPLAAPADPNGLRTIEHAFYGTSSQARFEEKYKLLMELDGSLRSAPFDKVMSDHAEFYDAAKRLMYDQAVAAVFRFSAEDDQRYGTNAFGRSCIVARNAVRARSGTVFISIRQPGWDTHQNMFDRNYAPNMYTLCNELDRGVGSLVQDLKASGDFDQTLILMMGEFGRTPGTLNARGGRDHHKNAMSAAVLGGGVKGGRVIGATDSIGERVVEPGWSENRPIVMEDIAATLYSGLGINWTKSITDTPTGRRFEYVPFAGQGTYTAVQEVFG